MGHYLQQLITVEIALDNYPNGPVPSFFSFKMGTVLPDVWPISQDYCIRMFKAYVNIISITAIFF